MVTSVVSGSVPRMGYKDKSRKMHYGEEMRSGRISGVKDESWVLLVGGPRCWFCAPNGDVQPPPCHPDPSAAARPGGRLKLRLGRTHGVDGLSCSVLDRLYPLPHD